MAQAVFHQQGFQSHHFRTKAHQDNAPGMQHIRQSGQAPGGSSLPSVGPQQEGKKEEHHQRQRQVHTVVPLNLEAVKPQALAAHGAQ